MPVHKIVGGIGVLRDKLATAARKLAECEDLVGEAQSAVARFDGQLRPADIDRSLELS